MPHDTTYLQEMDSLSDLKNDRSITVEMIQKHTDKIKHHKQQLKDMQYRLMQINDQIIKHNNKES